MWAFTGSTSYLAVNGIPWMAAAGSALFGNLPMISVSYCHWS